MTLRPDDSRYLAALQRFEELLRSPRFRERLEDVAVSPHKRTAARAERCLAILDAEFGSVTETEGDRLAPPFCDREHRQKADPTTAAGAEVAGAAKLPSPRLSRTETVPLSLFAVTRSGRRSPVRSTSALASADVWPVW